MEFLDGDAVVLCKGAEFTNFGVMACHKTFRLTDTQNAGVNLRMFPIAGFRIIAEHC
jgi:hypothetical protein